MDDVNAFITDNYIVIIVICSIIVMTIIGYIAKRLGFGEKISTKNKENKDTNIEVSQENIEVDRKSVV